jgi:tetratricopeptide (TPR) repeat protein
MANISRHLIGVGLIVALACGLYLPFSGNPPIFDDIALFSGERFSYYATHPFGLAPRVPPFFTFAVAQVLFGSLEVHRVMSLAFHLACSLALYKLIYDLLRTMPPGRLGSTSRAQSDAALCAFIAAAVFAVHPVAVYGAGYLVQRTIVLATLFSLLSLILFARGLARRSHADAISAGLMFTIAVLCKEHTVLLPAVAVLAGLLLSSERPFAIRHAATYLIACAPAAIFAALLSKGVIGVAYEPDVGRVAAQFETAFASDMENFKWPLSAVTQAGLFFQYLALWLWPDTQAMSIDLRVDFLETWSPVWILLKVSTFTAWGAGGFLLLLRRGRAGVAGFGLLYTWILFLVEFSTTRLQEPFVLYRSYLWAPGILLALGALLSSIPRRAALAAFAFACPVLLYHAHDRLVSLSSPLALWQDAVAKLPAKPVPWGSRTLYNLGREYVYDGRPDKAMEIVDRCMSQYPDTYHCYFARGAIYFELKEFENAPPYLDRAVLLNPQNPVAQQRLGQVLEYLGRIDEAKALYRRGSEMGFKGADAELRRLEASPSGLSRPKRASPTR